MNNLYNIEEEWSARLLLSECSIKKNDFQHSLKSNSSKIDLSMMQKILQDYEDSV